jgi:hypothetical protein
MALVVVRHRRSPALLHRQAGLSAIERLDLALLVDAEHHGLVRRIEIEPDDVDDLLGELRIRLTAWTSASDAASAGAPSRCAARCHRTRAPVRRESFALE